MADIKIPIKSLREHIESLAKKNPKKPALVGCDEEGNIAEEITYAELGKKIEAAAVYLLGLGLKEGDRVALAFKNSPELLILSWAAWASGIVTVPMDTKRDTGEQYEYKLRLNNVRILIAQEGALKFIEPKYLKDFEVINFSNLQDLPQMNDLRSRSWQGKSLPWETSLDNLALILFTSGTTGHPKGAQLSLKNLIINADGIRQWLKFTADDTFLVVLPLHHINSTTFCLSTLLAGGTIAIPPKYSNSHFWQQVAKSGATVSSVVQSIVFDQLHREQEYGAVRNKVNLNRIQIGSAPVISQSVQEFRKKFGIPLYQGYGQTETALRVTGVPLDISPALYQQLVDNNSIGVAMPWADLQISDESGKFLGEGEEGELVVKGPAIMSGYVGGEKTFGEQGDAKGYFLTGDIGFYKIIDRQRYFYLKGRKREIIIKGGVNISPIAVENALKKISEDIDQVHVVAVPDERYGEEIGAVISWKNDVDQASPVRGFASNGASAKRRLKCKLLLGTEHLSAYETPKYLSALPVEDLPMTSTGKVQRSLLKTQLPYERFESIYGLLKRKNVRFTVLHRYSRWAAASYDLYNKCWEPLIADRVRYEKEIPRQLIIMAADQEDKLLGQIAVIRTNHSAKELLKTKYADLMSTDVRNPEGKVIVCISICSADYKSKPIPSVDVEPTPNEVRRYLKEGHDPVMRFHQKPKGGLAAGASLVDVIPGGRPEDRSSLGYNMLLEYPLPKDEVKISDGASISNQLIEVVLLLAKGLDLEHIYAYSRPGGLASYISGGGLRKSDGLTKS